MSVLSKEDLMNSLKSIIGENASDESITLLENVSDTIDDFETRTSGQADWKTKYEENDRAWRTRYTERFFNSDAEDEVDEFLLPPEKPKALRFEDLFKEE